MYLFILSNISDISGLQFDTLPTAGKVEAFMTRSLKASSAALADKVGHQLIHKFGHVLSCLGNSGPNKPSRGLINLTQRPEKCIQEPQQQEREREIMDADG